MHALIVTQYVSRSEYLTSELQNLERIEESAPPLAGFPVMQSWALLNVLFVVATILLMLIILKDYGKSIFRLSSIVPSILAIGTFLVTEVFSRAIFSTMGLIDQWTIWMAAILLLQIIVLFLSERTCATIVNEV